MKKLLIALAIFISLIAGGVYFIALKGESLILKAAETHGTAFLGAKVSVTGVTLSPLKGHAAISGFSIGQPSNFGEGESFAVEGLAIDLAPMSVFDQHVKINTILIDKPVLNLVLHGKDSNFEALMGNIPPAGSGDEAEAKRVSIQNLYLNGVKLMIDSDKLGSQEATLADIHLTNIGVDENGLPPREALRITMDALKPQITKVLVKLGLKSKIGSELEKQLGVKIPTTKDGLKDALSGLLKKKKKDND